jgi:glucokinase
MTNLPWQFSQQALIKKLNLNSLTMINDYTAIAMAIPLLSDNQKVKIGGGETVADKPIAVCGPGTGLGVAHLVPVNNQWHCFSGEGGHVDFAAVDELDIKILQYLQTIKKRISYEQLLSGFGLEQIYQAICSINGKNNSKLSAAEISQQAVSESCPLCQQTLEQFCKVLGSFAGNLALTLNCQGGVYIAGGIVPRFIEFIENSEFRVRFETKGRLSHIPVKTPTYIIIEDQPGLLGAAAFLLQQSK